MNLKEPEELREATARKGKESEVSQRKFFKLPFSIKDALHVLVFPIQRTDQL